MILLLVTVVPLAGAGALTVSRVQTARAVGLAAERTTVLASEVARLTALDAAVVEEMTWSSVDQIIAQLEVPRSLVQTFFGSDPAVDLAGAIARTDTLLADTDMPGLADAVDVARNGQVDMSGTLAAYGRATSMIGSELQDELRPLRIASNVSESDDLLEAVDMMGYALAVRAAVGDAYQSFYAASFNTRDAPEVEIDRLALARATFYTNRERLVEGASTLPSLRGITEAIEADVSLLRFFAAVDGMIAEALESGAPERAPELTLSVVMADIEGFTDTYRVASEAATTSHQILDAAAASVLAAARALDAQSREDVARAYTLAALLTVLTLLTVAAARRSFVRPLQMLERSADALRGVGERSEPVRSGPREVKAAAAAIEDAASYLSLVTHQARALAAGELDADVLDLAAPGGIGIALHDAVGTLRRALSQQDEFRRRLAHEASHDGLTKLPNRTASLAQLDRSLARTARSDSRLAVLFVDLDRFKDVNDHHGHQAGDTVLTVVGQRLVTGVREGDHVGRLGGDEFVVIAEPVHDVDEALALARRLVESIDAPIQLGDVHVSISASIGIAVADGEALTADELIRDADLAVYRVKASGRGGVEICNEDLRAELAESADVTIALRGAIEHDELMLHYQPIVSMGDGGIECFEALVRWRRPGFDELVPPDRFIGLAERSNLIVELDRWVIGEVARQIDAWADDPDLGEVSVSINVSGRHLADDRFVDHVLEPLARHGVEPSRIIIEVTESALLDDVAAVAVKLQQLRDAGVRVSIDDFGTGYTSLSHLRSLPLDILKIDRSFVSGAMTNEHDASIVKLLIDAGHLLGASITAEGIETQLQAERLVELGSDTLQGFYFGRPQPADGIVAGGRVTAGGGTFRHPR